MKIDKENDIVAYNDEDHVYIEKSTGIKCISCTTLIHKFTQPFDSAFWSCTKALEALTTPEQFASIKEELYRKKKFDDKYVTKFGIQPEVQFAVGNTAGRHHQPHFGQHLSARV